VSLRMLVRIYFWFKHTNIRQIAVEFGVVEPVSNYEFIGNVKSEIVDSQGDTWVAACWFVEQGTQTSVVDTPFTQQRQLTIVTLVVATQP